MSELLRRPARERFGNSEFTSAMRTTIEIRGARENNLQNVDLEIPRDKLVVVTGNERVRQILPCVRHNLRGRPEALPGVDVDLCEAVHRPTQETRRRLRERSLARRLDRPENRRLKPRSTVGTMTDISDYLRMLFATMGTPHCPSCGEPLVIRTPHQMMEHLLSLPATPRSKYGRQPTRSTARTLNTCSTRFA